MARKYKEIQEGVLFEIIVVIGIVAIVAFTGQFLLKMESTGTGFSLGSGGSTITGFSIAEEESEPEADRKIDIGVISIDVEPQSPLIGEPFSIKITVANKGFEKITTPFYIEAKLIPNDEESQPLKVYKAVTQALAPGEEASVVFDVAMITSEGPLRIIATADITGKLGDYNPSNDLLGKTIIISSQ